MFKEHGAIKREVSVLRELVECPKASSSSSSHSIHEVEVEGESDDDDSAMSEGDEGELSKGGIIEAVRTMAGTIHSEGK